MFFGGAEVRGYGGARIVLFESRTHDSLYTDNSGVGGVADLGGEVVEKVETLVVGGQLVFDTPGRKDEKRTSGAGIEAAALGLPVGGDGFLLEVDDGEALVDSGIDNDVLGRRDGGRDEYDALTGFFQLSIAGFGEGGGELGALAGEAVFAVEEDGLLLGALQQEEASEGGVVAASDAQVEAALKAGFVPVTLGDSRLRTETAAIMAVATMHTIKLSVKCKV